MAFYRAITAPSLERRQSVCEPDHPDFVRPDKNVLNEIGPGNRKGRGNELFRFLGVRISLPVGRTGLDRRLVGLVSFIVPSTSQAESPLTPAGAFRPESPRPRTCELRA